MSATYAIHHDVTRWGDTDLYLFDEGSHAELWHHFGAHVSEREGVRGVHFSVWAPHAQAVDVIGTFNGWQHGAHALRRVSESGVWEGFIEGVEPGALYKYRIASASGWCEDKADPFGFMHQAAPQTASMVRPLHFIWTDDVWMDARAERQRHDQPMSVYEIHLGSWKRVIEEDDRPLTYRELAHELAEYVQDAGFTHVELLPITEHPFYGSWGYQTTGFFAPTGRYGTPQDLKYFVDVMHRCGIGVLLDWTPAHFPRDEFALARFDGEALYEHPDPRRGYHPDWDSLIFNYDDPRVRSFLLSSAMFWLEEYHIDGLRVDAVASMLYLDYSRGPGEWLPNAHGGRENLGAIALLQQINTLAPERNPGVLMIAEESTAWPGVTRPAYLGGLGFALKWDMGWMHDTLRYFEQDPIHRRFHHELLTFRPMYAFSERYVLALSHDEVVHLKRSLWGKMPGDDWQKSANLRLLLGSMYGQPGKKLMFMGGEFGQRGEWAHERSLDWHLLEHDPLHEGIWRWLGDLNATMREEPALHELDHSPDGFQWVDHRDQEQSVIAFLRWSAERREAVLVVLNHTPVPRHDYRLGVPFPGAWREILNSDAGVYGGGGIGNFGAVHTAPTPTHGFDHSLALSLPPLGALFLKSPVSAAHHTHDVAGWYEEE